MPKHLTRPGHIGIPEEGYVRLAQIIGDPTTDPPTPAILPIGRSTWFKWIREGTAPKPVQKKFGPRTTAWRVEDIRAVIGGKRDWRPAP